MEAIGRVLSACALLLAVSGPAHAQEADVGLVQQLAGEVSYSSASGSGRARVFMKMRQGDRFKLAAGAQVRVAYFRNGRQETWRGPANFRSGIERSDALSGTVYQVASLPLDVPQKIQKIPELIQMAKLGGVQVRGLKPRRQPNPEQQAAVAAARATYADLRQRLAQDDITPELYLFTALQDQLLYDEMRTVVDEMLRRQPGNPEAQQLAEWVRARSQASN